MSQIPPRELKERYPGQMPEPLQLAPLHVEQQGLYCEHLTFSIRLSPATLVRKLILATIFDILFFQSLQEYQELMTIDEGWNVDWKLYLLVQICFLATNRQDNSSFFLLRSIIANWSSFQLLHFIAYHHNATTQSALQVPNLLSHIHIHAFMHWHTLKTYHQEQVGVW